MIKIAILGAGAIADSHIQSYLKFRERCRIVAVVDLYIEKAAEKVAKHGLAAGLYNDLTAALDGADFDAASVCLPPFEHAKATVDLLRAGKHVLVEKPMATCLEECDAMLEAAKSSGRVLSVVAQNRFKTSMMRLKRVLESGLVGSVLHGQVDSFWWRGGNYYDLWWRGTWEKEGGGCTMNHAVHHIDLFLWMMGVPSWVQSVSLNLAHTNSETEDFSTSILGYPNGSVGQITASLVHHGEEQQLAFQGARAKVAVPWQVKAMQPRENGFPDENAETASEIQAFYDALPVVDHEGHEGQIDNFLEAIEGREALLVDGVQGRQAIELISAIYQSGHSERRVVLPLSADAPFYTRAGILEHARRFHEKTKSVANFATNDITFGRDFGR
ncbi:MAG: Gfo/Idh/MocA family oxidoreductase [Verrucomicrobia bacterium]|jgi:predicted dehydrogenase|nr:Gfo/Idh/MocA family oxidoreductase [Verrucomicrobiota bacterium]OQC66739.1 MAG: putative oxidoreductase YcjS [Verrucomicrobia bacterium ADurb.Bin006]MDI9381602.1 Gfo/Idh/MocA family oxidoreductase [Verrucomicrobiota bacterium]NMD19324.1 Gfo/Idh/MocA family oxidoreductase [Verrucomicrobiota bacterium]HNU99389.1 Gfo/Idh/MocA family oxidoreductase [Verrucomicrobiota bacterium]